MANPSTLLRIWSIAFLACIGSLHLHGQTVPSPPVSSGTFSSSLTSSPDTFVRSLSGMAAAGDLNALVRVMAQGDNGEIYIGGDFLLAGDIGVNYIARWDGSAWYPLGDGISGLDGAVHAIYVDGDNVYVGGTFTQAGNVRTRNIAVWNRATNTWSGFGGGVGGTLRNGVFAIAVHDGQVYVGGSFIAAGKNVAANIARWDGTAWHRVGTGINNNVNVLHVDGDYLYAGGEFTVAGDIRSPGIARYRFSSDTWESLGFGIEGSVNAITSNSQYIYIGGVFATIEGKPANNIIRVDKNTGVWSSLYRGLDGYNYIAGGVPQTKAVETILIEGDDMYVGGTFTYTNLAVENKNIQISLSGLAKWNGESWTNFAYVSDPLFWPSPFSSPPGVRKNQQAPSNIYAMIAGNDHILIGGDFDYVNNYNASGFGNTPSPYLCKFSIADSTFKSFQGSRTRKDDDPYPATAIAPIDRPIGRTESVAKPSSFHTPITHADLFRSASGSSPTIPREPFYSTTPVADDIFWQSVEKYTSNENGILALAADDQEIYAGGTFTSLYGIEANGIAMRKNNTWFSLDDGTALGVNGFVYAIVLKGSKVYVGGQFTRAGGVAANNIAVWDRTTKTWSALGQGVTGEGTTPPFVASIILRGEEVYVGGNFTTAGGAPADNIARWSSGGWSALGTGIDGTVNALEFFKENLYAGGSFTRAGESNSSAIAYWDGDEWHGMDGGVDGHVNDMVLYTWIINDDTLLAVGGEFTRSMPGNPENPAPVIARNLLWWNGSAWETHWSLIPSGGEEGPIVDVKGEVRDLMMAGTDLYVAGSFDNATPRGTGSIGSLLENVGFLNYWIFAAAPIPMWHTLQGGLDGNVNALALSGNDIVLGGDFTKTVNGSQSADHIAIWNFDKQDWIWAGNPTALAPVEALALNNGTLYAAGSFLSQDVGLFNITNYTVYLTGQGWRTVEGPLRGTGFAMTSVPGDELAVGGTIISSNEAVSVNISRWNSTTNQWNPLTPGSGVASLEDISFVSAVVGDQNAIYVGGDFDIADTISVQNIARWDRATQTWSNMGKGLNGTVYALTLAPDGTLYAGGSFNKSGNTDVNHIARWDGSAWQPVGGGLDGNVFALAVDNGTLYAGGTFRYAGGVLAANIARWDGVTQTWSNMGEGLTANFAPQVVTLAIAKGHLFAAGKFDHSGNDPISNIARWNPGGWWEPMGSGTDRLVKSLATNMTDGSIYAGGYFTTAGSKPYRYVGLWTDPTLSVKEETNGASGILLSSGNPNPFAAETELTLRIPEGKSRQIDVRLYDAAGRELRRLAQGSFAPGLHTLPINGVGLSAGMYFVRVEQEEGIECVQLIKW